MSIFDVALSFGKSEFRGTGQISNYKVSGGVPKEIAKIRPTHGSHSETTHSSSK